MAIHSTSIIHSNAHIHPSGQIGPYTIIESGVVIAENPIIGAHCIITGNTKIGRNNRFFQFCSIGEEPQDISYQNEPTQLVIGDNNIFREFVTVHRGTTKDKALTSIGDDNLFMNYCHIAHDCVIANHVIMANASQHRGHVIIGDHVKLGGGTAVHQFCQIGEHAFTGGGSIVTQDIPPYCLAQGDRAKIHGLNQIGLSRSGFSEHSIKSLKKNYMYLFGKSQHLNFAERLSLAFSLIDNTSANAHLAEEHKLLRTIDFTDVHVKKFITFVKNSPRGICR